MSVANLQAKMNRPYTAPAAPKEKRAADTALPPLDSYAIKLLEETIAPLYVDVAKQWLHEMGGFQREQNIGLLQMMSSLEPPPEYVAGVPRVAPTTWQERLLASTYMVSFEPPTEEAKQKQQLLLSRSQPAQKAPLLPSKAPNNSTAYRAAFGTTTLKTAPRPNPELLLLVARYTSKVLHERFAALPRHKWPQLQSMLLSLEKFVNEDVTNRRPYTAPAIAPDTFVSTAQLQQRAIRSAKFIPPTSQRRKEAASPAPSPSKTLTRSGLGGWKSDGPWYDWCRHVPHTRCVYTFKQRAFNQPF